MKAELSNAELGYATYSKRELAFYDRWVLGFQNKFIWKCPTERILDLYRDHLSDNHLEVGVQSGYFLANALPPGGKPRITLDRTR